MKPSLAICIPHQGSVPFGFTDALAGMMNWLGLDGFNRLAILSGSSSVGAYKARNGIMKNLLAAEAQAGYQFDWTLWLDSDMRFPPGTAQALIAHDKDIVGATYRRRSAPYEMLGKPMQGTSGVVAVGQLAEAAALPTGVLLVRRSVYAKMPQPVWAIEIQDGINDKGEDILFCERARALGYQVWLDTELTRRVAHIAEVDLWPEIEEAVGTTPLIFPKKRVLHG